jgi:diguanylate cyclase (GGDEF)-like protein/PAS domain S-box-containing protein
VLTVGTDRLVIRRLRQVGGAIALVTRSRDLGVRLPGMGRDEIGALAHDVNSMMEQLEHANSERARQEEQFRAILANSSDAITVVSHGGEVMFATPSVARIWGVDAEQLVGRSLQDFVPSTELSALLAAVATVPTTQSTTAVELRVPVGDGWRTVEAVVSHVPESLSLLGVVLINARDVTERAQLQAQLHRQAFYDSLTELPNRALFMERLEHTLADKSVPIAVLFIDLDDFKSVNDMYGHEAGDAVLVEVARRIVQATRDGDMAARFGGDEFVALLRDVTPEVAAARAEAIANAVREPMWVAGELVTLTTSVGATVTQSDAGRSKDLLRRADMALYRAKANALGSVVFDS